MNDASGFIDIQKRDQIFKLLKDGAREKSSFQVWQRDIRVRVRAKGIITKVDTSFKYIDIQASEVNGFDEFDMGDIYFFYEDRKAIFKSQLIRLSSTKVRIAFPDMVKVEDARCEPRTRYGLRSYQSMDISALDDDSRKQSLMDLQMIDSSRDGVGFLIRPNAGAILKVGDKIFTVRSTVENVEGRTGVIRSISKQTNNLSGEDLLRIGVELF